LTGTTNHTGTPKMDVLFQKHAVTHFNEGLINALRLRGPYVDLFSETPLTYSLLGLGQLKIGGFVDSVFGVRKMATRVKKHDVLHLNDPLNVELGTIARIYKKRLIVTLHGTPAEHYDWAQVSRKEKMAFAIRYAGLKRLRNSGGELVTITRYCADSLEQYTGLISKVILHGVSSERFRPDIPRGYLQETLRISHSQQVVLWVGRAYPNKDPMTFVRCAEKIARGNPQIAFVMILWYGGPLEGQIDSFVKNSEVLRKAFFTLKHVPWGKMPEIYASCDVYVHTSPNEGFGMAVAEAMSTGKPVVVADRGGPMEFVGQGGLRFKSREHDDLFEKVQDLLVDEKRRKAMGRLGRKIASTELGWDKAAENYVRLYKS